MPVALPALVSLLASPVYNTRYVILASIPFYLFAGAGLASLPPAPRALGLSGVALVMLLSQGSYFAAPIKHQWREAAAYLEPRRRPGDVLVFDTGYNEVAYAHYAPAGAGPALRVRLSDPPAGDTARAPVRRHRPGAAGGRSDGDGAGPAPRLAAAGGRAARVGGPRPRVLRGGRFYTGTNPWSLKGITVIEYVRSDDANTLAK